MQLEKFSYDNKIVKAFMIATVIFGLVGMLVGLTAATQLVYPIFNFDTPETASVVPVAGWWKMAGSKI